MHKKSKSKRNRSQNSIVQKNPAKYGTSNEHSSVKQLESNSYFEKTSSPIIKSEDAYNIICRSRMQMSSSTRRNRARSVSPSTSLHLPRKAHNLLDWNANKFASVGRKSILDGIINPYDLITYDYEWANPAVYKGDEGSSNDGKVKLAERRLDSSKSKSILKRNTLNDIHSKETFEVPVLPTQRNGWFLSDTIKKKVQFMDDSMHTENPLFNSSDYCSYEEDFQSSSSNEENKQSSEKPFASESFTSEIASPISKIESEKEDDVFIYERPPSPQNTSASTEVDDAASAKNSIPVLITNGNEPTDNRLVIDLDVEHKISISSSDGSQSGDVNPSVPPRLKSVTKLTSNTTTANVHAIKIECSEYTSLNFSSSNVDSYKLHIKNNTNQTSSTKSNILSNPDKKTSIMINGDDCYSTININNNVSLYLSSVEVKDNNEPKTSSNVVHLQNLDFTNQEASTNRLEIKSPTNLEGKNSQINSKCLLEVLLNDPVEAIRNNLVPHVCGKNMETGLKHDLTSYLDYDDVNFENSIEKSSIKSKESDHTEEFYSDNSVSTRYETMDINSDYYTDHSNRSSITEDDLTARTKFYDMLADATAAEISESEEHLYESIKVNNDPIYEDIDVPPPLPSNPPPSDVMDDLQLDKEYTTRSIFEGASKYDILSYLVDAKERCIALEDNCNCNVENKATVQEIKENINIYDQLYEIDGEECLLLSKYTTKSNTKKTADVERKDSGVGSESSKCSVDKYRNKLESSLCCEDCDAAIESDDGEAMLCRKCSKKRSERKEIIAEIVDTEEKYSRDLQIVLEEFYQPMLVAGLLTTEQLSAIFLNVEELLENSQALAERLRDAVEIAIEQGDEDLLTVNIGKIFLEASPMLHTFEKYCVRQGNASLLLASLEKEKELLRIFLRVSQMENVILRRMNLNSFLMVPVQRVTKYPLLLARLYKVTPPNHDTLEQLKEAQHKVELHLNHINSETKDVPSKLWKRINSYSNRKTSSEIDLVNIKLRKIAVDILEWNHDEAKFVLEGKLLYTHPTENNWRKGRTIKLASINALLVTNGKGANFITKVDFSHDQLYFSRYSAVREAALLLVRDKNGRYSLLRDPLYLDRCVIASDPSWQSYFEVQEILSKETYIFKAEDEVDTRIWYQKLQYYAQGMGIWRKRRNALANIMISGKGLRS